MMEIEVLIGAGIVIVTVLIDEVIGNHN